MPLVYLARHGETDWNRAGRYQGRRESNLTELGLRQAGALAGALRPAGVARIVSSPLTRCVETAAPLAAATGLRVETDARLVEIAHGTWEGRLRDEIERDDGARLRAWRDAPECVAFPGGESLDAVFERWLGFAGSLDGKNDVATVTHDVVVRVAILWAAGRPLSELWKPPVVNGGYAVFETGVWPWTLRDACVDGHLEGLLADASRQAL